MQCYTNHQMFVKHWNIAALRPIKWSTKAGSFKTKRKCDIEFKLPAFHDNRKFSCTAYVDELHQESCNYDMIIGQDIIHSLGISLLFDIPDIPLHLQPPEILQGDWIETLEQELLFANDPASSDVERNSGHLHYAKTAGLVE